MLFFFWLLSKRSAPPSPFPPFDSAQAKQLQPSPLCSHTHSRVTLSCQCAQNCQSPLKALDAMCNSFNTRPRRYPYHCRNGVLMPPCILRACTRQLVIHLIYSTGPALGLVVTARIHGWTLSSLRPSEVISGSRLTLSQDRENIIHDFLSADRDSGYMRSKVKPLKREKCSPKLWCFINTDWVNQRS